MKKRTLLVLLLLLIPLSYAEYEDEIFNKWVYSGSYFNISGEQYRVIHVLQANTTVLYLPSGHNFVIHHNNESCSDDGIYQVCYDNIKYEKNGEQVPPTINDPNIDINLKLIIKKSNLGLEVEREFETEDLFVGKEVDVTTTINKIGEENILNITYKDVYPDFVKLSSVRGSCKILDNSIIYKGDLNMSNKRVCYYTIEPLKDKDFINNYSVDYMVLSKRMSKNYDKDFEVGYTPLTYNIEVSNKSVRIYENVTIKITLTTTEAVNIRGMNLDFPDHFKIVGHNFDSKELTYSNILDDDTKEFNLTFYTGFSGNHTVNFNVEYDFSNVIGKINENINVYYWHRELFVELVNKTNHTVIRILNPHELYFRDIKLRFNEKVLEKKRLDSRTFYEWKINKTTEKQEVELSYRTISGQIITNNYLLAEGERNFEVGRKLLQGLKEVEEVEEKIVQKPKKKIEINTELLLIIGAVLVGAMFIFGIFSFIKSRKSSSLDREIAELKKQINEIEED